MTIEFRRARRDNVSLIIGLIAPSGGGKTYTAMRLASGICGFDKPFAVIDTEAGRAKHYADQFNFDHADLKAPFRPERYADAIISADEAGYPVIVVDSCSHEWAGEGGVLDWAESELDRMAGNDWQKRERVKMASWIKPKMGHKKMVQRLLQVRAHLILCFRAEQKIEMVKNPKTGKVEIVPMQSATGIDGWIPVCEKTMPYELTASFLLLPTAPGVPQPIKLQEQHREMFPTGKAITEQSGKRIDEWARGGEKHPDDEFTDQRSSGGLEQAQAETPETLVIDQNGEQITPTRPSSGDTMPTVTASIDMFSDGQSEQRHSYISVDQAIHIGDLLRERGITVRRFLKAAKVPHIEAVYAANYERALQWIAKVSNTEVNA